jgi:hypothetical protein
MKRRTSVKKLLMGLIVIILIIGVGVYSQFDAIIKTGVETAGPEVLQVDVTVENISVSPFSGQVKVSELAIGQPDGYGDGPMVQIGEFDIKVDPTSMMKDHIVIDEIMIDQPLFDARIIDGKSNFQSFQQKLEFEEDTSAEQTITMTIKKFVVQGAQLSVSSKGLVKVDQDIAMADFTLTNMGTDEKGLTPKEIARHVMDTLQPQIAKALIAAGASDKLKALAKDARGGLEEKVGGFLNKLKKKDNN